MREEGKNNLARTRTGARAAADLAWPGARTEREEREWPGGSPGQDPVLYPSFLIFASESLAFSSSNFFRHGIEIQNCTQFEMEFATLQVPLDA